ncbi:MAG: hypothetical protein DMG80_19300 [Acidobacteria bacterium]|nr:MAG: hypothetical protein DMG80_19300 [Acidobacteriota bacterium]
MISGPRLVERTTKEPLLLLYQTEFLPAGLLSVGNSLATGFGDLAGSGASVAPQSFERIDGMMQSLNGGLGFLQLSFEDRNYVKASHTK